VGRKTITWLNENPDQAELLLPEVVRWLRWRSAPWVFRTDPETGALRSAPYPTTFRTCTGRELSP
jgi:hypothetical protein